MGNLGGGEILVILLVALIVLGPTKLPPAVRQVGKVVGEIRRIGQGFQAELREAAKPLTDATADLKAADKSLRETTQKPLKEMKDTLKAADPRKVIEPPPAAKDEAKDATASGKRGDASGTAAAEAAAAGPVSWGTAEARVSPPPAAGGEDTDATADAVGPDAESKTDGTPD
ncbi:MAG: twin-arginine translocase subunit TatB [Acidimicrobiaceae bacterium]|nr:twin-arginine translocase subunit TatB [Acidimicrobiaceae bacterium]MYE98556.1 twin-arginine translocase subunit TatB [Acidimicrobiaceae bacterium]MYH42595.1 twin-arginine translocase subunit TatB [Acidimicrobiaceae bacterium]MYI53705.1 twin-arginine translocase subunit TatB [Acidimicrobiaceae bacterium]MYK74824.1 twin-arginine translocase subunit TatB [Acidimicrobiaceae bacterium]